MRWFVVIALIFSIRISAAENRSLVYERTLSQLLGQEITSTHGSEFLVTSVTLNQGQTLPVRFYIQGGLHGNEHLTTNFVHWLSHRVAKNESIINQINSTIVIDFVANINPDSGQRNNPRNINLNRNFSVLWGQSVEPMGHKPFSEAETRAIKALFQKFHYRAAIDIHGYLNWLVLPTKPQDLERNSKLYEPWARLAEKNISLLPGYEIKTAGELGDGGAFEDWAYWQANTLAICLEMKYPTRFFPYGNQNRFDSFLAYERFIFKMLQGALKINAPSSKIAQKSDPHRQGKELSGKNSH